MENKSVTFFNKYGKTFYFNEMDGDYIYKAIKNNDDFYESELLDWLFGLTLEDGIIIDCGANIGNHTVFFSSVMNKRVISLEPNPKAFSQLQKNILFNNLNNVTTLQIGAGSSSYSSSINVVPGNLGASKINKDQGGNVPVQPIDSLVGTKDKIVLIKIDVEGMELDVIKGATSIIERDMPFILVEAMTYDGYDEIQSVLGNKYVPIKATGITPIICFCHKSKLGNIFEGIDDNNAGTQWLSSFFNQNKKLQETNSKYRAVTATLSAAQESIVKGEEREGSLLEMNVEKDDIISSIKGENESLNREVLEGEKEFCELVVKKDAVITQIKEKLQETDSKYRAVTATLSAAQDELGEVNSALLKAKDDYLTSSDDLNMQLKRKEMVIRDFQVKFKNKDLELERTRKSEVQAKRIKSSLSFQLGHAIIFGFKSFGNFISLPSKLLNIRRQAKKIRKVSSFKTPLVKGLKSNPIETSAISDSSFDPPEELFENPRSMKVASIMDDFTFSSFAPECQLTNLDLDKYLDQLENTQPDLIFIESAWRGLNEKWGSKVCHTSDELVEIISWAKERKVPTVFWNKEDPIHFETFLTTAKLFDFVFTTDIDRITDYKLKLGHSNVYLMPFAAQPKTTNPIQKYKRKDGFCFAGAYYKKYPERTADLEGFVGAISKITKLEIYDRNYDKNDSDYKFPEEYSKYIVGTLPFSEIDKAYKGYKYSINLNSIKQSQTMFARRVFELMASNTAILSNFSRGIRLMFGDLTITTDNTDEAFRRINILNNQNILLEKQTLLALRKVMSEHTYEDRMNYIKEKIWGNSILQDSTKNVAIIAVPTDELDIEQIKRSFDSQTHKNKKLIIVTDIKGIYSDDITIVSPADMNSEYIRKLNSDFLSFMHQNDYYAPNYITDLVLATKYSTAKCISKAEHYSFNESSEIVRTNISQSYRYQEDAYLRSSIVASSALNSDLENIVDMFVNDRLLSKISILSIDRFNYCRNAKGSQLSEKQLSEINDLEDFDTGISMDELRASAEKIGPAPSYSGKYEKLKIKQLISGMDFSVSKSVLLDEVDGVYSISSSLADGTHEYFYSNDYLDIDSINGKNGKIDIHMDITPGLNLQLVVFFLKNKSEKISNVMLHPNKNNKVEIPDGTTLVRLGFRVYSSGSARVNIIYLDEIPPSPKIIISKNNSLVLTNNYPSYDDLYKNAFIHSRARAYKGLGYKADICCQNQSDLAIYEEYQNINIVRTNPDNAFKMASENNYKNILVHFMDRQKWEIVKPLIKSKKVIIWAHGADIQPYHRRSFMFVTDEEHAKAKEMSKLRVELWKEIFECSKTNKNIHFIYVSEWFAKTVFEDYSIKLDDNQYSVIHNFIDPLAFPYKVKQPEDRLNVLSIRPYASLVYANDITAKVIMELSKRDVFNKLTFNIIGDGVLFDEVTEEISNFNNVKISRKFLTHEEIADEHSRNGIFLVPTRMDTQGVSRDEAMSSGLVPITTNVAAIPEFVDGESGVVVDPEDHIGIADEIERLVGDGDRFSNLSVGAHNRVSKQSSFENTVVKETILIDNE